MIEIIVHRHKYCNTKSKIGNGKYNNWDTCRNESRKKYKARASWNCATRHIIFVMKSDLYENCENIRPRPHQ